MRFLLFILSVGVLGQCAKESECTRDKFHLAKLKMIRIPICPQLVDNLNLGDKLVEVKRKYGNDLRLVEECPYISAHDDVVCGDRCYRSYHEIKTNEKTYTVFETFSFADSVLIDYTIDIDLMPADYRDIISHFSCPEFELITNVMADSSHTLYEEKSLINTAVHKTLGPETKVEIFYSYILDSLKVDGE